MGRGEREIGLRLMVALCQMGPLLLFILFIFICFWRPN
jgi:hypothetical protein